MVFMYILLCVLACMNIFAFSTPIFGAAAQLLKNPADFTLRVVYSLFRKFTFQRSSSETTVMIHEHIVYRLAFFRCVTLAYFMGFTVVIRRSRNVQQPAYFAGGIFCQLLGGKFYPFRLRSAKYAVAFFSISFSIFKSAFSF